MTRKSLRSETRKVKEDPESKHHFPDPDAFVDELQKVWYTRGNDLERFAGEVCENLVIALVNEEKVFVENIGEPEKEEQSCASDTSFHMSVIEEMEEMEDIRKLSDCYTPHQIRRKLMRGKTSLLEGRKKGRTSQDMILYGKYAETKKRRL